MRYSIIVREYGSDRDTELMQVAANPEAIVEGLRRKQLTLHRPVTEAGRRAYRISKYTSIRVIDHEVALSPASDMGKPHQ